MQRREFLKTVNLLAMAGSGSSRALSGASVNKRNIRKGIMYETVKTGSSVLEKFQAVKAADFEGIEPSSHMDQAEVLSALKTSGLSAASVCCSTHWKKPLTDPDPAIREGRSARDWSKLCGMRKRMAPVPCCWSLRW